MQELELSMQTTPLVSLKPATYSSFQFPPRRIWRADNAGPFRSCTSSSHPTRQRQTPGLLQIWYARISVPAPQKSLNVSPSPLSSDNQRGKKMRAVWPNFVLADPDSSSQIRNTISVRNGTVTPSSDHTSGRAVGPMPIRSIVTFTESACSCAPVVWCARHFSHAGIIETHHPTAFAKVPAGMPVQPRFQSPSYCKVRRTRRIQKGCHPTGAIRLFHDLRLHRPAPRVLYRELANLATGGRGTPWSCRAGIESKSAK